MIRFALTIFLSAFLLFQVQPLIGKYILPWFGGTSGVWTTCLLFFQIVLLIGYAYAHFLGKLPWKRQAAVHLVLLAVALVFLPIEPAQHWRPVDGHAPTLRILLLLAATIGLPYMVLSSTGPLLQNWFSATYPGRSPYRLYSLSNVGSLLALITFPIFVETNLSRQYQVWSWSIGFGAFALCCGWCAAAMIRRKDPVPLPLREGLGEGRAESAAANVRTHVDATLPPPLPGREGSKARPSPAVITMWLLLSAAGSAMLLATTNQLTAEVAVVPFLWVIPLALYLVTFIICFDNERWYSRTVFGSMLLLSAPIAIVLLYQGVSAHLWLQITGYSGCMFACCMTCHGELVRSKPDPKYLTLFYLLISAGGALGGLCVAVLAPLLLNGYYEYHFALFAAVAMTIVAWARAGIVSRSTGALSLWPYIAAAVGVSVAGIATAAAASNAIATWPWHEPMAFLADAWTVVKEQTPAVLGGALGVIGLIILAALGDRLRSSWGDRPAFGFAGLAVAAVMLGVALLVQAGKSHDESIYTARNFYGVLHVEVEPDWNITYDDAAGNPVAEDLGPQHKLVHGRIMHGFQFRKPPQSGWPTSYYARNSGVGIAIDEHPRRLDPDPKNKTLHIGCIGLGTGTLASYGQPGDKVRIYEINPAVEEVARTWFTYLKDSGANPDVKVVLGDARVMLERELERGEVQQFDVLAVDAFSSDAIPVHLLTKECAALYFKHLKPDGILALHISNRFIDLEPVTHGLAKEFNKQIIYISNSSDHNTAANSSSWVLLTDNKEFAENPAVLLDAEPWKWEEKVTAEHLESVRHESGKKELEVGDKNPQFVRTILWTDDFASLWELLEF